jgi:hypothetical protein
LILFLETTPKKLILVPVTVVSAEQISKQSQPQMSEVSPQQSEMEQSQIGKAQTQSGLEQFDISQQPQQQASGQPTPQKEKKVMTGIRTPMGERELEAGVKTPSKEQQVSGIPQPGREKETAVGFKTPKGEREAFIGKRKWPVSPTEQITPQKKAKAGMELTASDAESLQKVTKSGQLYFRCIWVKMSD